LKSVDERPHDHHVALIAIVDFPNGVGGDTRRVHMLARCFGFAGVRTTVVIPCSRGLVRDEHSDRSRESMDGFDVVRISSRGSYGHAPNMGTKGALGLFVLRWTSLFRSLPVLWRLKRRGLTALYLYQPTFYDGITYWLAARLMGLQVMADYCDLSFVDHDRIERSLARRVWSLNYRWGLTRLPARLDRAFVISRYLEEYMAPYIRPERVRRLPPMVDSSLFDVEPPAGFLSSRHGIAAGSVILYAGSFFDNEGVPMLLQAVPRVLARHPEARFLIVGGHPEEALDELRSQAARLGVEDQVVFAGVAPSLDMPLYFRAARILVAPKTDSVLNRAGVPTKLVEYLASGRPVVISAVGDIPLMVEDGKEAVLVPPDDPVALAEALSALLSDPVRAKDIGERGRDRVRRDYDVPAVGPFLRRELDAIQAGR
jgi:glycosyltransferase involved in cell wall biosynthesis